MLKITVGYCKVWHYTERAVGLAGELLNAFESEIESLTLTPSDGGRFEVTVNDRLLYSKLETRRHAEPGEIAALVRKSLGK